VKRGLTLFLGFNGNSQWQSLAVGPCADKKTPQAAPIFRFPFYDSPSAEVDLN